MEMFEKANREKIRFPYKGLVSVEDLWDLSVEDLDGIYKRLNSKLKESKEDSLLERDKTDTALDFQVAIVRHIVEVKLAEAEERKTQIERKEKRQKIMEILSQKQDASMQAMSVKDLQKMLNEL